MNIKLFPIYPSPPPVKAWQVPLFTVRYQAFMDENWDLTLQRVWLGHGLRILDISLTLTDCTPYQRREQRPHNLHFGRYGLLSYLPSNPAFVILWLSFSLGYILIFRHICTYSAIQLHDSFRRGHAARVRALREHSLCSTRSHWSSLASSSSTGGNKWCECQRRWAVGKPTHRPGPKHLSRRLGPLRRGRDLALDG